MEGFGVVDTEIIKSREKQLKHVRSVLESIEKTIEGRILDDVESYEIGTPSGKRRINKIPMTELIVIREKYFNELKRLENQAGGKKRSRQILMRL